MTFQDTMMIQLAEQLECSLLYAPWLRRRWWWIQPWLTAGWGSRLPPHRRDEKTRD